MGDGRWVAGVQAPTVQQAATLAPTTRFPSPLSADLAQNPFQLIVAVIVDHQLAASAATLRQLLADRTPAYAQADLTVQSREVPHEAIVSEIITALDVFLDTARQERAGS